MKRMLRLSLLLAFFAISQFVLAHPDRHSCERMEEQRESIYRQLRKGHSVARARQLKERLRELRSAMARKCR